FEKQTARWAFAFPRLRAGRRSAARIAMIAMTTMSSISVKPLSAMPFNFGFISLYHIRHQTGDGCTDGARFSKCCKKSRFNRSKQRVNDLRFFLLNFRVRTVTNPTDALSVFLGHGFRHEASLFRPGGEGSWRGFGVRCGIGR